VGVYDYIRDRKLSVSFVRFSFCPSLIILFCRFDGTISLEGFDGRIRPFNELIHFTSHKAKLQLLVV
jgi:hypothetical protein